DVAHFVEGVEAGGAISFQAEHDADVVVVDVVVESGRALDGPGAAAVCAAQVEPDFGVAQARPTLRKFWVGKQNFPARVGVGCEDDTARGQDFDFVAIDVHDAGGDLHRGRNGDHAQAAPHYADAVRGEGVEVGGRAHAHAQVRAEPGRELRMPAGVEKG